MSSLSMVILNSMIRSHTRRFANTLKKRTLTSSHMVLLSSCVPRNKSTHSVPSAFLQPYASLVHINVQDCHEVSRLYLGFLVVPTYTQDNCRYPRILPLPSHSIPGPSCPNPHSGQLWISQDSPHSHSIPGPSCPNLHSGQVWTSQDSPPAFPPNPWS